MSNITLSGPDNCETSVMLDLFDTSVLLAVDWSTGASVIITVNSKDGAMWLSGINAAIMFNTLDTTEEDE